MIEGYQVVILGGGLAGLGAGFGLSGADYHIFEAEPRAGGVCRSVVQDGFVFDHGPHILFPRVERARELIRRLLDGNLVSRDREAWIYHLAVGGYTRFPFQHHLHGLSRETVKECLMGAIEAYVRAQGRTEQAPRPANYRQWIEASFGEGIARHLMIPYARKLWTVEPEEMDYDWIGDRVPVPELDQIIEGAITEVGTRFGFNPQFWYPLHGGIEALPRAFLPHVEKRLSTNRRAVAIDLDARVVRFADGSAVRYDALVYTLPLPELNRMVTSPLPGDITRSLEGLMHNSILCVNLGIDREAISDKQWVYFYEDDFPFHRISFPMNLSPETVPPGTSSVSTEIAYSAWRPVDRSTIVDRTVDALRKAGILRRDDRILLSNVLDIHYAYIIHDHHRRANLDRISRFLLDHGVIPCGRFGRWEYLNMDRTIESGLSTADQLIAGSLPDAG